MKVLEKFQEEKCCLRVEGHPGFLCHCQSPPTQDLKCSCRSTHHATGHTRKAVGNSLGSGPSPECLPALPVTPSLISLWLTVQRSDGLMPEGRWHLQLWAGHIPPSALAPSIPEHLLTQRDNIPQTPEGGGSLPMAVVRNETTSDSFPSL